LVISRSRAGPAVAKRHAQRGRIEGVRANDALHAQRSFGRRLGQRAEVLASEVVHEAGRQALVQGVSRQKRSNSLPGSMTVRQRRPCRPRHRSLRFRPARRSRCRRGLGVVAASHRHEGAQYCQPREDPCCSSHSSRLYLGLTTRRVNIAHVDAARQRPAGIRPLPARRKAPGLRRKRAAGSRPCTDGSCPRRMQVDFWFMVRQFPGHPRLAGCCPSSPRRASARAPTRNRRPSPQPTPERMPLPTTPPCRRGERRRAARCVGRRLARRSGAHRRAPAVDGDGQQFTEADTGFTRSSSPAIRCPLRTGAPRRLLPGRDADPLRDH